MVQRGGKLPEPTMIQDVVIREYINGLLRTLRNVLQEIDNKVSNTDDGSGGGGGSTTWGDVSGTLSDQIDLQAALDTPHTGDVTGMTVLTLADNTVGVDQLSATGTADSSTVLRGDNTWAAVSAPSSSKSKSLLTNSGRWYCYTDKRWVTDSDDNYGPNYYQFNESGGTGATPVTENEHLGMYVPAGATVKGLSFVGRTNNTDLTDFTVYAIARYPNPASRWETGLDNDGEDTDTVLVNDSFWSATGQTVFTGNSNDTHRRKWELDTTFAQDIFLSIYIKPIGPIAGTSYIKSTYTWELEY